MEELFSLAGNIPIIVTSIAIHWDCPFVLILDELYGTSQDLFH